MRKIAARLNGILLAAWFSTPALADDKAAVDTRPTTITVTALRNEKSVDEVPATVTVLTDQDKEKILANDIRDLLRYETGISVRAAPARFTATTASTGRDGNAGFSIRGLEGNRVLIVVDGVRLPLAFSTGSFNVGRGNSLDLDAYQRIEILRGPAATLYGSDGLAGAVSFLTKEPGDLLGQRGQNKLGQSKTNFVSLKTGYASVDRSWVGTFSWAGRLDRWEALFLYTRRSSQETENKGDIELPDSRRTAANPQKALSDSVLAKLIFKLDIQHQFKIIGEKYAAKIDTDGLSSRVPPPLATASIIDLKANDRIDRRRMNFVYEYRSDQPGVLEKIQATMYRQDSDNRQQSDEQRFNAAARFRDNRYRDRTSGLGITLHGEFAAGLVTHRLVYGGELSRSEISAVRSGINPPPGETFPVKAFPDTRYDLYGVYLQDELWFAQRFSVIPGIRYEGFRLNPRRDDAEFPLPPAALKSSAWSPKLGGLIKLDNRLTAFTQFARGFKAPHPFEVNNALVNLISNVRTLANPDLRPEIGDSWEIGLRGLYKSGNWELLAFAGRYKNFIERIQLSGNFTAQNPTVFQWRNLSRVEIRGTEGKASMQFDHGDIGKWRWFGNFAYARAQDIDTGRALDSIDPLKVVTGLEYSTPRWRAQAVYTAIRAKDRISQSGLFASPRANVIDLLGAYQFSPRFSLQWAVFNITDKKYWLWTDVRGQAADSAVLDAYTQAGRNFALTLKISGIR